MTEQIDLPDSSEAPEIESRVAEVSSDIITPTFEPEAKVEHEMPVEQAETIQAAVVEVIEAASQTHEAKGGLPEEQSDQPEAVEQDQAAATQYSEAEKRAAEAEAGSAESSPTEATTETSDIKVEESTDRSALSEADYSDADSDASTEIGTALIEEASATVEDDGPSASESDNMAEVNTLLDELQEKSENLRAKVDHVSESREAVAEAGQSAEGGGLIIYDSEIPPGEELSEPLEDLSITALIDDSADSDEDSPPPLETDQGEGVSPMHIETQKEDQARSQGESAVRGEPSGTRKKKSEFGEKLGSFAKGVAQVGLSAGGEGIPGASVLDEAISGAFNDQPEDPISADENAEELDFTEIGAAVSSVQPGLGQLDPNGEAETEADDPAGRDTAEVGESISTELIDFSGASESQLEALDMQNTVEQVQQYLTMISQLSKTMHDTSMSVIRNMGDRSDDEPENDPGPPESGEETDHESPGDGEKQVESGLKVNLDSSRSKTSTGKSFSEVAASGLSKAADAVMSAGSIAAPFIPGGAVLSAAMSGMGQLKNSVGNGDNDDSADSRGESPSHSGVESGMGDQEGQGETSEGSLALLFSDPEADISTVANQLMMMAAEDMEQDISNIADEIKAMNEVKNKQRELIDELKQFKSEAAKALHEQYHTQEADPEVTFTYHTLEQVVEGVFQLVEGSETLPREEAANLVGQMEGLIIEGSETFERATDVDSKNALRSNIRDAISTLREEIVTMEDELSNWPDGETRTITYNEVAKQSDGSYEIYERTKTMTNNEAKSLVTGFENMIAGMEKELEALSSEVVPGESIEYISELVGSMTIMPSGEGEPPANAQGDFEKATSDEDPDGE